MGYSVGIMGFGKMPGDCVQILLDHGIATGFVLETEESRFSSLEALCARHDIPFRKTTRTQTATFLDTLSQPTVIFSANNNFIFPERIVGKKNLRIVNFHNAVLPSYRGHGQAIPPWIIYNQERRHGVTWHLVSRQIDAGNILCQDIFDVSTGDTAMSVMMRSIRSGIALFAKWWESFLDPGFHGMAQSEKSRIYQNPMQTRLYKKSDLPNNGYLDLSWDFDQTSRFLRSMDYSRLELIESAKVVLDGEVRSIKKYRIEQGSGLKNDKGMDNGTQGKTPLRLSYPQGTITLHLKK